MRYIVVKLRYDVIGMEDGREIASLDCTDLVFCDTAKKVESIIACCDEFSIFEMVHGKPVRKSYRWVGPPGAHRFEIV